MAMFLVSKSDVLWATLFFKRLWKKSNISKRAVSCHFWCTLKP